MPAGWLTLNLVRCVLGAALAGPQVAQERRLRILVDHHLGRQLDAAGLELGYQALERIFVRRAERVALRKANARISTGAGKTATVMAMCSTSNI